MRSIFIIIFLLSTRLAFSTDRDYPPKVEIALRKAGLNRIELEKVIRHFAEKGDSTYSTLYKYGLQIQKPEDCLVNLFRNYQWVVDDNDWLQLISYRYVGVMDSKRKYAKIVRSNFKKTPPLLYYTYSNPDSESYVLKLILDKRDYSDIFDVAQFEKNTYKNHIGDEIYLICFNMNSIAYQYYILINPQTMCVFDMANMWSRPLPLPYFDDCK